MNKHQEYTQGIQSEKEVIAFLKAKPSTQEENIYQDIDYYFDNQPVSLKTQHMALKTGNLAFELSVTFKDGTVKPSWYTTGKATVYHLRIGKEVYSIQKQSLLDYVFNHGFDSKRHLSNATRASQVAIAHSHIDAEVGLIKATKLMKANLLTLVGVIN
jgi:molybdopterin-binding protein